MNYENNALTDVELISDVRVTRIGSTIIIGDCFSMLESNHYNLI